MRRSSVRAAALVATAALVGPAAVALAPSASATSPGYAIVRGAHFSPDTPGVDVYLTSLAGGTSTLWLFGVTFLAVAAAFAAVIWFVMRRGAEAPVEPVR